MEKIIKCEDYNYFDPTCKTGYYTVGDKHFYRKITALHEASRVKKHPTWNFNYEVYQSAIKNHIQYEGLNNLYKRRAQQLRDNYDYVILAFSGGSDSDTVLRAFINNGIKLDEVWHDTPLKFLEKSNYVLNTSLSSANSPSEHFFVARPELEKLAKTNPEIKIHLSDSCASPTTEDREDTASLLTIPLYYSVVKRHRYIDDYMKSLSGKYKRVCLVMGVDKLIPWYNNNSYGFMFSDNATWNKLPNIEYFFWTPDMPEIVVEQGKRVWDYLLVNDKIAKAKFLQQKIKKSAFLFRSKSFEPIVKSILYPTWDNTKHQVDKYSLFNGEHVAWFNDTFKDEYFFQSWKTNYDESIRGLDIEYSTNNKIDYTDDIVKFSNMHKLGEVKWDM